MKIRTFTYYINKLNVIKSKCTSSDDEIDKLFNVQCNLILNYLEEQDKNYKNMVYNAVLFNIESSLYKNMSHYTPVSYETTLFDQN